MDRESLGDRFNSASTLTKAMITAGVLLAFLVIAMVATRPRGGASALSEQSNVSARTSTPTAGSQIQTIVVRQDAEGYTSTDLTPEALKLIERDLVKGTIQRAKEHVAAQGLSPNVIAPEMFRSSSWVMEASGRRFGIVDIHADPGRVKTIVSIQDAHFVRVSCIDPSGASIPTFYGKCADKIQEVFGVRLPKAN